MTRVATLLRLMVLYELVWAVAIAAWLREWRDWPLALAALAGVAAPLAVHCLVVGANFIVASLAGSPTPPAHRLGTLRAVTLFLRECADSIRVFQWAQPWLASRALARGPSTADRVPVLLVHGYFCNRQVWRQMARMLARSGHAVEAVDLEPVFASIDEYVPIVRQGVERLMRRTGAARVALVCHSMGGLAARAYLRAHGTATIARVVTLGTPHHGTEHARYGIGPNARQMRRASAWLETLSNSESPGTRALFTVVLSHHDNIVTPQAQQTLPGARLVEFSGLGHLTLACASEVGDAVTAELARG